MRGEQVGTALKIVTEAIMDGKDAGIGHVGNGDLSIVVPKSDTVAWVHRVDPFGRHLKSVKRIADLESEARSKF